MTLVAVLAGLVFVCGVYMLVLAAVEGRRAAPPRGDWWTEFEREFRAYAQRTERGARSR